MAKKRLKKSSCAEADAQQELMTGEAARDRDGMSLGARAQSNNGGYIAEADIQPTSRHSSSDFGDLKGLAKAHAEATDPLSRQDLGNKLTLARLRLLHERQGVAGATRKAQQYTTTDPPEIAALRKQLQKPGIAADVRAKGGEILTRYDLAKSHQMEAIAKAEFVKSAYEDQVEQTAQLAASTQAQITSRPASLGGGQSGGAGIPNTADGRARITGLSREDLAAQSGYGNGGNVGSAGGTGSVAPHVTGQNAFGGSQGELGAGGVSSLPRLEKELADATDPILKARLGEQVTLARLAASHR